jgi:amidase
VASLGAGELVEAIGSRRLSRREVALAYLRRIERLEPMIGAFVDVAGGERLLAAAEAADAQHEERGGLPLDGVPVSVKDALDVAGMVRSDGLRVHAGRRSPADCEVVGRLRAAGALIVGTGNQPALQLRWNTVNDVRGPTRNPRALDRSAGGSSGGDAAAVAAGMAAVGIGVDSGGSIRVPAAFCEVWGLRPTTGRVPDVRTLPPLVGGVMQQHTASIGPLARCVGDLERVFGVIAGPDARDPVTVPLEVASGPVSGSGGARGLVASGQSVGAAAGGRAGPSFVRGASRHGAGSGSPRLEPTDVDGSRLRVARLVTEAGARVEPELVARVDAVCAALAEAGHEVVEAEPPGGGRAPELWARLSGTDAIRSLLPRVGNELDQDARASIEALFGPWELGGRVEDYLAAHAERRELAVRFGEWLEQHPIVVAPIAGMSAPSLDFDVSLAPEPARALFDRMRNVLFVNLFGLPAVALPNGVQIIARRYREDEALAVAWTLERRLSLNPAPLADP